MAKMGIFNKLKKALFQEKVAKQEEKSKKPTRLPTVCHYNSCSRRLTRINTFKCSVCSNYYCQGHKLPTDHDCKGKPVKKIDKVEFTKKALSTPVKEMKR